MNRSKAIKTLPALLLTRFAILHTSSIAAARPLCIALKSCTSTGTPTEVYNVGDSQCITGLGFVPSTTYDVHVVNHVTFTEGTVIPARIPGSVNSLTTDASGSFFEYLVWADAQACVSDIVIDMNGDGVHNSNLDALDGNHTTGVMATPEYPIFALFATVAGFAAFAVFKGSGGLRASFHKTPAKAKLDRSRGCR